MKSLIACAPIYALLFELIFQDTCTYCPTSVFFVWVSNFATAGIIYISIVLSSWSYWFKSDDRVEYEDNQNLYEGDSDGEGNFEAGIEISGHIGASLPVTAPD